METFDVTDIYARPVIDVNASDVKVDRRDSPSTARRG